MKIFGSLSIIMGLFLIISIIVIYNQEKDNRKKLKIDLVMYLITGIILVTTGILSFFNFFKYWTLICTLIMLLVLIIFITYITISDKKGKKIVKYKTTGHGKNKRLVEKKEKFEDK